MPNTERVTTGSGGTERLEERAEQVARLEGALQMHIKEAAEAREIVLNAARVLNRVTEFFKDVPEISLEILEAASAPSEPGKGAVVKDKESGRLNGPIARSLMGLAVVLVIGLVVPTQALPSALAPVFDPLIFVGIAVFGWLGLLAAFRERHRDPRRKTSRQ